MVEYVCDLSYMGGTARRTAVEGQSRQKVRDLYEKKKKP
jgi:hypothetical protein